jgi:nitrilase
MKVKIAVVQEAPVFFDKTKTLEKVAWLCRTYAAQGCQLILFPESFVPGYPRGLDFGTKVGSRSEAGRELYLEYYKNSLNQDDIPALEALCAELGIYLVLGATEQHPKNSSLYCSMFYFGPEKGLLGIHRKIKPTAHERVIWAEAGAESLVAFDTEIGVLGGLICWENYMPQARMALYGKGVQLYLAPTADSRPQWTASMQHIALEGRCFVLACNQYITQDMHPEAIRKQLQGTREAFCEGGSLIVSPLGEVMAGPLFGKAGVLMATLDLDDLIKARMDFDVIGHYARPDIFGNPNDQ